MEGRRSLGEQLERGAVVARRDHDPGAAASESLRERNEVLDLGRVVDVDPDAGLLRFHVASPPILRYGATPSAALAPADSCSRHSSTWPRPASVEGVVAVQAGPDQVLGVEGRPQSMRELAFAYLAGARPNFVKMAPVVAALRGARPSADTS